MKFDWQTGFVNKFQDGKYNLRYAPGFFPPYLHKAGYPFAPVSPLTHLIDNKQSIHFSGPDSPERLEENLKLASADWKYRTKTIEYHINANGYRAPEWDTIDWKNSIVILGCSCTFGVGQAEDETISYYLEQLTGRPVVNLGYSAASNQLLLDNAGAIINQFEIPYAVVANWTTTDRMRFFTKYVALDLGPWTPPPPDSIPPPDAEVDLARYWEDTFVNVYNELGINWYLAKNMAALWKGRSKYVAVSYYPLTSHYMRADAHFQIDNKARDMIHPGSSGSKQIAEYIDSKLKGL